MQLQLFFVGKSGFSVEASILKFSVLVNPCCPSVWLQLLELFLVLELEWRKLGNTADFENFPILIY